MNLDSPVPIKDPKERQNPLFEVITTEKQLWALVHSKGLLPTEVQDLYHKARSGYEKIILNDQEEVEYQDVEYSLWKLHYKHIDEFRKRIRPTSAITDSLKSSTPRNAANVQISIDLHAEHFKSFLSEATEFYQNLITKMRRQCGLCEDPLFSDDGGASCIVDPTKLDKCQYSCHRFLVCLGDLARYRELCKKLDSERHDWSVAATHYFKATLFWPDSGNPQNQLALLATYTGDDFVALYHCIRSLAIKEPFPDAWDNLSLLFEKNRSSHLDSLSKAAHFDFLNPSERSTSLTELQSGNGSANDDTPLATEHISSTKCDLWPLFVRMTSFFLIESSFEEFPCTFASTMRELDSLLALDDTKLKASLESYQHMDSSRTGPYRALQMVSVLIFIIDSLTQTSDHKESMEKNNVQQQLISIESSLTATFICLGRLTGRCLKGNNDSVEHSPLMPAVLVFVEWLVGMLDKLEIYGGHEKVGKAISYFFDAFVGLLNRLDKSDNEFNCQEKTAALWEDYELRGFTPLSNARASLYFMTDQKVFGHHDRRDGCCGGRLFRAAMRIVDSSKLIFYDHLGRKFFTAESEKLADQREAKVLQSNTGLGIIMSGKQNCEAAEEDGKATIRLNETWLCKNGKAGAVDEEEVILFKPITRYNSAPLCPNTEDEMSKECKMKDQPAPSDECLRRATSLCAAQDQTQNDHFSFRLDDTNFRYKQPLRQQEPLLKDSPAYPSGPPSLSSWVFNRETSNTEKEKGRNDTYKPGLTPITEIPSDSLTGLSIGETEDSLIDSMYVSPPCYSTPMPSAPLLPDDAIWFTGNPSSFSEVKSNGNFLKEGNGILGAPPLSSYSNFSATHGPLGVAYPAVGGMSSSEWLYQYSNQNLGSFYGYDGSRFDLCDRWGNPVCPNRMVYLESPRLYPGSPLSYSGDKERREMVFRNFQRPSPHGCAGGTELGAEQPPLLHYLKEREWQLQQQQQVRGPAYMGN
ncbi:hypothetical protein RHMOL_Rhmol13G0238200 [Rhododendron molle]|uniref:Uncharacterized protein n=2 Tax=Rhododendron molle TaxID=49168 RepID=A0ACC0LA04_RHOML|nr:hypothetical protein RHMOL_Rhmol13G0238200 [Rhododendron molle]KAI8525540.1 hypothetical protein RHMOL_Rhmol13G0238200 [Rhododendron molle]